MGVDAYCMVGVYLEIESDNVVEEAPARGCPDHDKEEFFLVENLDPGVVFCKKCGKKYEPRVITKTYRPNVWRLLEDREDLEDMITDTHMYEHNDDVNTIVAISNEYSKDKQPTIKDLEYNSVIEISPQIISEYVKNFETKFKDVIDYLKTKAKSVEIKFGAILYYS